MDYLTFAVLGKDLDPLNMVLYGIRMGSLSPYLNSDLEKLVGLYLIRGRDFRNVLSLPSFSAVWNTLPNLSTM